jgi:hypothetical protein
VHCHFCLVPERAPVLVHHYGQVQEILMVGWEPLADMSQPAIWRFKNTPKHEVAIHCAIVKKCHSNPCCLEIHSSNIAITITELSPLFKHAVKFMSLQDCSDVQAHPKSTPDEYGAHNQSVFEQVGSLFASFI